MIRKQKMSYTTFEKILLLYKSIDSTIRVRQFQICLKTFMVTKIFLGVRHRLRSQDNNVDSIVPETYSLLLGHSKEYIPTAISKYDYYKTAQRPRYRGMHVAGE